MCVEMRFMDAERKDISPPASLETQRTQRIFVFDLQAVRPVYLRGRDDCKSKESRLRYVDRFPPVLKSKCSFHLPASPPHKPAGCATGK
ncbi:MAG: hypothetical protein C4576_29445 [Desulfobacteraceae bacterium]|nr:MAG: hypothetical protein C4576_29445 [Desulfobacteraceae bacterium]